MARCSLFVLFAGSLLVSPLAAHAKCSSYGLSTWPLDGEMLNEHSQITITAVAQDRRVLRQPAALLRLRDSHGALLGFRVVSTYEGGYRTSQIVIAPLGGFRNGESYWLERRLTDRDVAWHPVSSWSVTTGDDTLPVLKNEPRNALIRTRRFGCGPAIGSKVKVGSDIDKKALYDVTLRNTRGEIQRARLISHHGIVYIGHGMCGGMFAMNDASYRATITPINTRGDRSASVTIKLVAADDTASFYRPPTFEPRKGENDHID